MEVLLTHGEMPGGPKDEVDDERIKRGVQTTDRRDAHQQRIGHS